MKKTGSQKSGVRVPLKSVQITAPFWGRMHIVPGSIQTGLSGFLLLSEAKYVQFSIDTC